MGPVRVSEGCCFLRLRRRYAVVAPLVALLFALCAAGCCALLAWLNGAERARLPFFISRVLVIVLVFSLNVL